MRQVSVSKDFSEQATTDRLVIGNGDSRLSLAREADMAATLPDFNIANLRQRFDDSLARDAG